MNFYDDSDNFVRAMGMSENELWNLREEQWIHLQKLKKEFHDVAIKYTVDITKLECDLSTTNMLLKGRQK